MMMLELKERLFAELDALGFAEVWARRKRGKYLGNPRLVREWLELNDPEGGHAAGALGEAASGAAMDGGEPDKRC